MKHKSQLTFTFRAIGLAGILGFSGLAMAADKTASCPVDHRHMGHGDASNEIDSGSKAFANAKRIADKDCSDCHGKNGVTKFEDIPDLAGQEPLYLCKSMEAYRIKARVVEAKKDLAGKLGKSDDYYYVPSMNEVADKLSDQDIVDLSEYYAHLHAK